MIIRITCVLCSIRNSSPQNLSFGSSSLTALGRRLQNHSRSGLVKAKWVRKQGLTERLASRPCLLGQEPDAGRDIQEVRSFRKIFRPNLSRSGSLPFRWNAEGEKGKTKAEARRATGDDIRRRLLTAISLSLSKKEYSTHSSEFEFLSVGV